MATVSMKGLDLGFLRSEASKKHLAGIRRENRRKAARRQEEAYSSKRSDLPSPSFMMDLNQIYSRDGGIKSPVTGELITSRSQMARHNRANNVRQSGDLDYKAEVAKAQAYHAEISKPQEGISFSWKPAKT